MLDERGAIVPDGLKLVIDEDPDVEPLKQRPTRDVAVYRAFLDRVHAPAS